MRKLEQLEDTEKGGDVEKEGNTKKSKKGKSLSISAHVKAGASVFVPPYFVQEVPKEPVKVCIRFLSFLFFLSSPFFYVLTMTFFPLKERLSDEELKVVQSWVVYKDKDLLIINKPYGLPVQGYYFIAESLF